MGGRSHIYKLYEAIFRGQEVLMNVRTEESGPMADSENANSTAPEGAENEVMNHVVDAVEEFKDELGANTLCEVDVTVDGKWCTFEGTVDSQEVRTALFDLVPSYNGKRFIVDRLHVTYEVDETSEI
jgi:hypothetical protein